MQSEEMLMQKLSCETITGLQIVPGVWQLKEVGDYLVKLCTEVWWHVFMAHSVNSQASIYSQSLVK